MAFCRVDELLKGYEFILSEAMTAGINITSEEKDFKINWDYLQSVFFSTTILTTIGIVCQLSIITKAAINKISGYGNIAPVTFWGRLFCILFAIIGNNIQTLRTYILIFYFKVFHSVCL